MLKNQDFLVVFFSFIVLKASIFVVKKLTKFQLLFIKSFVTRGIMHQEFFLNSSFHEILKEKTTFFIVK